MKPVFPTYIIKKHAKAAMRGRFFKAFAISVIPPAIIMLIAVMFFLYMPGVRSAFELGLSGRFESVEARQYYLDFVTNKYIWAVELIATLFAFLSLGAARLCLDMVRGKEVKVRNVFSYYNKWYIAAIYPALSVAVTTVVNEGLGYLTASGVDAGVVTVLSWVFQIALYFVTFKLIFIDYTLAENNCSSFIGAVKAAWKMVGWNTVVNYITLSLSFIGWLIISCFTFGLALIYVIPYFNLSLAALYEANVKYNAQSGMRNE